MRSLLPALVFGLGVAFAGVQQPAAARQSGTGVLGPDLVALLDQYRHGDADAAVKAFGEWEPARIHAVTNVTLSDDATRLALTALYAEARLIPRGWGAGAYGLREMASSADEKGPMPMGGLCERIVANPAAPLFNGCRAWMLLSGFARFRADEVVRYFPDDAEAMLELGIVAEMGMEPTRGSVNGARDHWSGTHGTYWLVMSSDAASRYKRALRADPHQAEAHLRLGRVMYLLDRLPDAMTEFERARADAATSRDTMVIVLANLFLGQSYEDQGKTTLAERAFEQALAADSSSQTIRAALARLRIRDGRLADGWSLARGAFDAAPAGDAITDPWHVYQRGAYRHVPRWASLLREAVRQ